MGRKNSTYREVGAGSWLCRELVTSPWDSVSSPVQRGAQSLLASLQGPQCGFSERVGAEELCKL